MATRNQSVTITRWPKSQHPTTSVITREMKAEGLRPYLWSNAPNHRYAVRSHNYHKVLYVIEGSLEIMLPDTNQRAVLRAGDRLDVPAGVRHGATVGSNGASCVEAAIARRRDS